uniref:Putative secreted protein 94 n=1 Tax=Amblyomma parvum TaxID=251391 RepID=A0A023FYY4_AMBPA
MLLVAFLIVGFELCAAEGASTSPEKQPNITLISRRSVNLVRKNATLKLILYSSGIKHTYALPKCMSSDFLKNISQGANRTLQIDDMNTNISIRVTNGSGPALNISSPTGKVPDILQDFYSILHATPKHCIILQAPHIPNYYEPQPPCVLLAFHRNYRCEGKFLDLCGAGDFVDLKECYNMTWNFKPEVEQTHK